MIPKFAPPDKNMTANYLKFLRQKTGVKDNAKIKNFTLAQFEKLWRAIEQMEGTRKGKRNSTRSARKDRCGHCSLEVWNSLFKNPA